MSTLSLPKVPVPKNEPVRGYAPGSPERRALEAALAEQARGPAEIPLYVEADAGR